MRGMHKDQTIYRMIRALSPNYAHETPFEREDMQGILLTSRSSREKDEGVREKLPTPIRCFPFGERNSV